MFLSISSLRHRNRNKRPSRVWEFQLANILFVGREWGWAAYMFTVKDKESEATQIPINTAFVDVRRFLIQTLDCRYLFWGSMADHSGTRTQGNVLGPPKNLRDYGSLVTFLLVLEVKPWPTAMFFAQRCTSLLQTSQHRSGGTRC